ncbi:dolichyl-P-Man:Man(5)GlcNAc(2)-PP-dolichol alpha-1,3-mannosyltransferase [Tilletia horrida]|nr:dolichyl-P-Man:Man(5)GlcNAc(2)-PP-dolichol alpha-1,3-mannosyltransferase [Tilletia horrida]
MASSSNGHGASRIDAPPPLHAAVVVRGGAPASVRRRLHTRRRVQARLSRFFSVLPILLLIAGHVLFFLLPFPVEPVRRKTYVDENALQPAQSSLFWGWDEVKTADTVAEHVSQLSHSTNSSNRAEALRSLFTSYGLTAYTQEYTYDVPATLFRPSSPHSAAAPDRISGTNTYALFRSPRTDGREAILITASWKSRWNGFDDPDRDMPAHVAERLAATGRIDSQDAEGAAETYDWLRRKKVNVRGVSSVIALSQYLSRWLHHSKDIIFVISDGHLDGMQAWASAYFGDSEPSDSRRTAARVGELHPSVLGRRIWTSISLDYPSDSFSALAFLHEGVNAGSPNMDVVNTAIRVAQSLPGTSSVPVLLHGALDGALDGRGRNEVGDTHTQAALLRRVLPSWLVSMLERYVYRGEEGSAALVLASRALLAQFRLMAAGHPSGPHGLLHKYRIDAFSIYAVPAQGPYGFYHMGRVVESTLRSFSNLVERLHHSQFFYLLTDPWHFIQLPTYIVVPVLLGIAITIFGLRAWAVEGKVAQRGREEVAEAFEAWLDWQEQSAASKAGEKARSASAAVSEVGDDSFAEVEGLLAGGSSRSGPSSSLRQRASSSRTAPRRSERIRASASPEPSGSSAPNIQLQDEIAEDAGEEEQDMELQQLRHARYVPDVLPEKPTATQIETELTRRTCAVLSRLSTSGKLVRKGHVSDVLLTLRQALRKQDRPVWSALGVVGVAHVVAGVGVLGLLGRLDSCKATGLWGCRTYHLLQALSIGFPHALVMVVLYLVPDHKQTQPAPAPPPAPAGEQQGHHRLSLPSPSARARLGRLLHAFTLLYAGMLVSVLSVLNFALATSMGLLLALPLCLSAVPLSARASTALLSRTALRFPRLVGEYVVLLFALQPALGILLLSRAGWADASAIEAGMESVWVGWKVWGNATLPFVGGVYQAVVWMALVGVGLEALS